MILSLFAKVNQSGRLRYDEHRARQDPSPLLKCHCSSLKTSQYKVTVYLFCCQPEQMTVLFLGCSHEA